MQLQEQGSPPAPVDAGARRIHIGGELILYRRCPAAPPVVLLLPYLINFSGCESTHGGRNSFRRQRPGFLGGYVIPVQGRGWGWGESEKPSPARFYGDEDGDGEAFPDGEFPVAIRSSVMLDTTRPWPSRPIYHNDDGTAFLPWPPVVSLNQWSQTVILESLFLLLQNARSSHRHSARSGV